MFRINNAGVMVTLHPAAKSWAKIGVDLQRNCASRAINGEPAYWTLGRSWTRAESLSWPPLRRFCDPDSDSKAQCHFLSRISLAIP